MLKIAHSRMDLALALLLAALVVRLWVQQMNASFWVDEMVTAFVVHHGAADPSLAVAPQVPQSIYYAVPRAADRIFGTREAAYRAPSLLFALGALWLVGRIAARLIHPQAAWFAVFACFGCKEFNWEAPDARPYALGFLAMAAAVLLLIRWLDSARWRDAAAFVILAALIWRVQLIFWPAYALLAIYATVRLVQRETPVSRVQAAIGFTALGFLLLPVAVRAIALNRQAGAHVIVDQPTFAQLFNATQWKVLVECAAGAWIFSRMVRAAKERKKPEISAAVLAFGWCLIPPVALFLFSKMTGESVFVRRYYSIALPGAALAAACGAAYFLPARYWKPAAAIVGIYVLIWYGWRLQAWPGSDWREAAAAVNALPAGTPVIVPSPFIEAKGPDWRPDYPLPGFLYAHLDAYPLHQPVLLFPFHGSAEAETYAATLTPSLLRAKRFAIYGGDVNVHFWSRWFLAHPRFSHWTPHPLGVFGDVQSVVVESSEPETPGRGSASRAPGPSETKVR